MTRFWERRKKQKNFSAMISVMARGRRREFSHARRRATKNIGVSFHGENHKQKKERGRNLQWKKKKKKNGRGGRGGKVACSQGKSSVGNQK